MAARQDMSAAESRAASFWRACREGDEALFSRLLGAADLRALTRGTSALVAALQSHQKTLYTRLLADPRTDVNSVVTSSGGHTVLHWAVMMGDPEALEVILAVPGLEVDRRNSQGDSALRLAVRSKKVAIVRRLCREEQVELGEDLEVVARMYWDADTGRQDTEYRRRSSREIVAELRRAREERSRREEVERNRRELELRRQELERTREELERTRVEMEKRREEIKRRREELERRDQEAKEARERVAREQEERLARVLSDTAELLQGGAEADLFSLPVNSSSSSSSGLENVWRMLDAQKTEGEEVRRTMERLSLAETREDECSASVTRLAGQVRDKVAEVVRRLDKIDRRSGAEQGSRLQELRKEQEVETKEQEKAHSLQMRNLVRLFRSKLRLLKVRQEAVLEGAAACQCHSDEEMSRNIEQILHNFEHEEEELQEEQEQKMGDMLEQQERDKEQTKEQQRDSALALLEDPASLSPLRARAASLLRSLSLLTSRPAQLQCPECPVCYESLRPPASILQCASGHLLCGGCAARVEQFICPTCREEFTGRATAMEQLLARLDCHQLETAGVA